MLTAIAGSVLSGQLMSRWGCYRYIALAGALHDVFLVGLCVAALAFLVVLFLPEVPLRGR